jgi:biotin synthase
VITQLAQTVNGGKVKRVCIQALNYPEVFLDVSALISELKQHVSVQISVSCQPRTSEDLWLLSNAGADRVGIALDAATEKIFRDVKGANAGGPYDWQDQLQLLRTGIGIFGEGNVSTHLIVGLGETEIEAASLIQKCTEMGVLLALFAFTPVEGTALAANLPPKVEVYRRIQLARYLIINGIARIGDMTYDQDGRITDYGISKTSLAEIVDSGKPFLTSGCSDCNRPFYNEKPSGPIYNYPRPIHKDEIARIRKELGI